MSIDMSVDSCLNDIMNVLLLSNIKFVVDVVKKYEHNNNRQHYISTLVVQNNITGVY